MNQDKNNTDPFQRAKDIRAGKLDDEMPMYDEFAQWIHRLPVTWLGGILRHVLHAAFLGGFFATKESCLKFCESCLNDATNPMSVLREHELERRRRDD